MKNRIYDEKLEVIKDLMEELMGEMDYGPEEFDERLGRKKPELEAVVVKGELPMDEEDMEEVEMMEDEEEDEESSLMRRIAALKK